MWGGFAGLVVACHENVAVPCLSRQVHGHEVTKHVETGQKQQHTKGISLRGTTADQSLSCAYNKKSCGLAITPGNNDICARVHARFYHFSVHISVFNFRIAKGQENRF